MLLCTEAYKMNPRPSNEPDPLVKQSLLRTRKRSTLRKNQTVLVVDDSDEIREMFRAQLELLGFRVVEAADGQEAIDVERTELPELIFMDLMMPILNGLQATRLIREKTTNSALIIIACTCLNDDDTKRRAFAAGCNDYVQKPFALGELPVLLHRYLHV